MAASRYPLDPVPVPANTAKASVQEFRQALAALEGPSVWLRRGILLVAFASLIPASLVWQAVHTPPAPSKYATAAVDVGDVVVKVNATGTVQPLSQVNVSAQVSGVITKVKVDMNAVVRRGDVLAEIDSSIYGAQASQLGANVAQAEAQATSARAVQDAAKLQADRTKALFDQGLASKADLDAARGQLAVAVASVKAARAATGATKAQLDQASASLRFTRITSPIDGVVIARTVEVGSTVVASFQAPNLFTIAQDLKEMLVLADVDEADVAKVREGLRADIVVDAYPGESFPGTVQTLSFGAANNNGVVTYTAFINVANPLDKLRPGLTANVTIRSSEARNVVRVPNSALRYNPSGSGKGEEKVQKGFGRVRVVPANAKGDEAKVVTVRLGLSDGLSTEVVDGSLLPGVRVATGDAPAGGGSKGK
jgi:HlyD family secretion protein